MAFTTPGLGRVDIKNLPKRKLGTWHLAYLFFTERQMIAGRDHFLSLTAKTAPK
jgi:hypothetical protein